MTSNRIRRTAAALVLGVSVAGACTPAQSSVAPAPTAASAGIDVVELSAAETHGSPPS